MSHPLAQAARVHRPSSIALFGALRDDPFYRTLELRAAPRRRQEAMLAYYDISIFEAARYGRAVKLDDASAGVSVWSLPLAGEVATQKATAKEGVIQSEMGQACLDAYTTINANLSSGTARVVDPDDWYLSVLGLAPSHQGKGLGAGLLRPVLDEADAAGRGAFLETFTPRNMSFYRRLGFADVGAFDEPETGSRYWVMRRPAGASA